MSVADRVYARALFGAATEKKRLAPVREELGAFVAALGQVPELRSLLRNPQIDKRAKAGALDALLGEGEELVRNFLRLLVEKGRIAQVEEIGGEFERLVAAAEGQLTVELTTAYELSDKEAHALVEQIEKASGRKVEATRAVDPAVIGGVVLRAGSLLVDASVRGRLAQLRQTLAAGT